MWCNPYLFQLGSVLKFGPEGGTFYGNCFAPADKSQPVINPVSEAPAGAVSLQSGYLAHEVKVVGMKWRHAGCGPVPASDTNWGNPSCVCMTSRLAVDEYGRVFAPDAFRFSVDMLDAAGNAVGRIGRYGNADGAGPNSACRSQDCLRLAGVRLSGGREAVRGRSEQSADQRDLLRPRCRRNLPDRVGIG